MKHTNRILATLAISILGFTAYASAATLPSASQDDGPTFGQASNIAKDAAEKSTAVESQSTADAADDESSKTPATPPKAKHVLTQNQAALRDQVRQTLASFQKQPFNTRQNTPGEIMDFCLPYGCNTEITLFDASGERRANGITSLCWNFPSNDIEPLTMIDGRIAARLGYGVQSQPSQLLATLAFARVQETYPLRVEKAVRTVADLVESEKRSCREGTDLSLKLVGMAYYANEETWQNDLGEDWSVEKIVKDELNRQSSNGSDAGMNRLVGLAYVNYRRAKQNLPLEGQYARADKYMVDLHKYAFSLQNQDGSWGYFLSGRGTTKDAASDLRSTAYVAEWLALSLPEDQLGDARVAASMNYLVKGLNSQRNLGSAPNLPAREINSLGRALHALSIYDDRFNKTAAEDKPAPEKTAAKQGAAATQNPNSPSSR